MFSDNRGIQVSLELELRHTLAPRVSATDVAFGVRSPTLKLAVSFEQIFKLSKIRLKPLFQSPTHLTYK